MQRRVNFKNKFFTKAFPRVGAGERLHGFCTKQVRGVSELGASLPTFDTCLGKTEAPLGCGDGLNVRLSLLEHYIHHLALAGNREGLREALYEYLKLSGGLCK